jgi:Fe-S cluster biogenesis protein NfuA
MRERVEEVLDEVRPALVGDGGNVELVDVEDDGTVRVRLVGSCAGCPMSQLTLKLHIERILKERIPEVSTVEQVED